MRLEQSISDLVLILELRLLLQYVSPSGSVICFHVACTVKCTFEKDRGPHFQKSSYSACVGYY